MQRPSRPSRVKYHEYIDVGKDKMIFDKVFSKILVKLSEAKKIKKD